MSGRNPWEQLNATFDFNRKERLRLELELVLTFSKLARTKYSMGNIRGGNVSRNNAETAYRTALKYFRKLSDVTSLERRKWMGLFNQAKDAIVRLQNETTH